MVDRCFTDGSVQLVAARRRFNAEREAELNSSVQFPAVHWATDYDRYPSASSI